MAKYCATCGTELSEEQDVCLGCGTHVKKPKEFLGIEEGPIDPVILILLIIVFFPAAIIYYLLKKGLL